MQDYFVTPIRKEDTAAQAQVDALLHAEGIRRDACITYTCGIYDASAHLIATGSCFSDTLRCFAVSREYRGEGLLNRIVSHLIEYQLARGYSHLFVYTKSDTALFFRDLGFYEIAHTDDHLVFMENTRTGFKNYLSSLERSRINVDRVAAIVMNANPFTLGHQYLVSRAADENDIVHLFLVSDDRSLIPYKVRKQLVLEGTLPFCNVIFHDCGSYMISSETFPSYFQKDDAAVIRTHANLDLTIFTKIAEKLGITSRYVGEEHSSLVTGLYNQLMRTKLPAAGIDCVEIPRLCYLGTPISASTVRYAIQTNRLSQIHDLVPESTYRFFIGPDAGPVITALQTASNVIHY